MVSEVIQPFVSKQGIKQGLHISCHAQHSGVVEGMKQTIKNKLEKIIGQYPKQWTEKLSVILAALRNSNSSCTSLHLWLVLFGQSMPHT